MKQCYQQSIEDILFDAIRDKAKDDYFIGSMDNLKKKIQSLINKLMTPDLPQIIKDGASSIYDETYGAVHNINVFCLNILNRY